MEMVTCSGNVVLPPLIEIRENPEFHDLMRMDKAHWPRCLLWHGWLPMLSGVNGASPWALDATESAPDHPNVWSDGSLVLDKVAGISSSGAGFFANHAAHFLGCS